ncbi:MAG: DUF1972 domain-containing protein [Deltaproteobacteria bacterium]|nr:DUF1972 domain-containing protein [Deltaproteobacteria bacterium]
MKIAICGIRGIPASYGGFETFAEELSVRLVAKGHEVLVYGRTHVISHNEPYYRGVRIILLPAIRHKYLETPLHSLLCFIDLCFRRADVVLVCNAANSPFAWLLRLAGLPVAINVDGIERHRAKWNKLGKLWYKLGEIASVKFANRLIADAQVIADYYAEQYSVKAEVIRYGYNESCLEQEITAKLDLSCSAVAPASSCVWNNEVCGSLGVSPNNYVLYVSRLEPENNAHVVIEAYNGLPQRIRDSIPLVVVGDAPYAGSYIARLKRIAGPGVLFAGYRFGEAYRALQLGARVYVQATEVGGTHPALVEAMGFANCIIANKTPENEEVLGDAGLLYEKNSSLALRKCLEDVLMDESALKRFRKLAHARARTEFAWGKIVNEYEELLRLVANVRA